MYLRNAGDHDHHDASISERRNEFVYISEVEVSKSLGD